MTTCCLALLLLGLGLPSVAGEKMSGEEETRTMCYLGHTDTRQRSYPPDHRDTSHRIHRTPQTCTYL